MCDGRRKEKVKFEPPAITLDLLIKYGKSLVDEQDNVRRVQLAEAYMSGAELAGTDGSSMPEEIVKEVIKKAEVENPELAAKLKKEQAGNGGACLSWDVLEPLPRWDLWLCRAIQERDCMSLTVRDMAPACAL